MRATTNRDFKEDKNMDLINELLNCLNSIDYDIFDEDYLNELLDSRDSTPFDTEWCRVDEEIEALKNTQSYTGKNEEEQGEIREKAFMIIEALIQFQFIKPPHLRVNLTRSAYRSPVTFRGETAPFHQAFRV